ncbi:MICOS complex subunit MIC60 [Falsiroseomonas selenitidurans]|uniref:Uncharacterized protein n=1 Tax=Falsiroseomonas selenitidurans TaxID=2716335 RepID=A0ABX1E681_9PROT|nr:hypothetical protein [Falsiroseomonas selenitidurans]NKC32293.1 hypothetical protein [Falsiroseomonas selenitidurans]
MAGFLLGLAVATCGLVVFWPTTDNRAQALPAPDDSPPAALLGQLEIQAARAEAAARQAEAVAREAAAMLARNAPQSDRFLIAALLLRASLATPRPWLREYQAMLALAPAGALPPSLAEVLASHAARGLPSEAELQARFALLAPQLLARMPRAEGLFSRGADALRGTFASLGLAAPPAPGLAETAIAGITEHLRRGNLAGAVADAGALDGQLQPLLAGWVAQARARLAVEQAIQEVLLRALAPPQLLAAPAARRPS